MILPDRFDPLYPSCVVGAPGDVNGDGLDDILFGAQAATNNGRTKSGTVYVIFGREDFPEVVDLRTFDRNLQGDAGFRIDGGSPGDFAGNRVDGGLETRRQPH